jgi:hypothetical protein
MPTAPDALTFKEYGLIIRITRGLKPFSASRREKSHAPLGSDAYGAAPMLNWLVQEKGIAPHIPVFDKSKRDDGIFSRSDFRYDPTGDVYHCPGGKGLERAAPFTRVRPFCIVQASSNAMYARSNRSAAQRSRLARSRAISMSTPETLLVPLRTLTISSSHAVSARRSRCGLRTSSVS